VNSSKNISYLKTILRAEKKLDLLQYQSTPVQEFYHAALEKAGVRLMVKREDLNHPFISGNKWWKLKYNLEEAQRLNKKTLLTFGGAYSNHIYAVAAAAEEGNFRSIGIIRGEKVQPLNPTLRFATEHNMQLHHVSREDYRKKNETDYIQQLHDVFGDFYMIPEGGTNIFALNGCAELGQMLLNVNFDYLCLATGTGGTMAGIIEGLAGKREVIGISVLKGDFLTQEISKLLETSAAHKKNLSPVYGKWRVLTSYHHGGYAKVPDELKNFIREMYQQHNLPLDPVYTGKLMWAVLEEVKKGFFKRGSTILALHTGGLQGAVSYPNLYE
jgi:1-aminocyclopropane-1-carboxylate deaminase/D-cysteine desulfhydrase-like pyridoxal-dependent ACC family enzyme